MKNNPNEPQVMVIEPVAPWGIFDIAELRQYTDLLYFLVWRTIKVQYAQSVGGLAWAVMQPAAQVLIFSLVFGGLVGLQTGDIPYPLFSTVAVIPWTYMSGAMAESSSSLLVNSRILGKIYFPRLIFPATPIISNLFAFAISTVLIVIMLVVYRVPLTLNFLLLPVVLLMMILVPFAFGLWLSSLAIRYRDVGIAMGYFMRMLMYAAPILYASEEVSATIRPWYILNPIVGVIEGFRSCLLGTPVYWDSLTTGLAISVILTLSGAVYFRRMERVIVDVI